MTSDSPRPFVVGVIGGGQLARMMDEAAAGLGLVFVIVGASSTLDAVIGFSDSMIFAMSLANIVGLYLMAGVVKRELFGYRARLERGEIVPVADRT